MKRIRLSDRFSIPAAEWVTQTSAILAVRGAGKSNLAGVIAEGLFAAHEQVVVIDPDGGWWGLRSSSDGKGPGLAIPIFGGEHGDVPLERTSGELVADLIVEKRLSCVLDLSGFESESARKAFLLAFAKRIYQRNRRPLHLILEEADDYIPQKPMKDELQLLRAWENIVRRGRKRGLGLTLITQRSAVLAKNVLTQVETLFVLRTTSPQDRAAVAAWVKYHAQSDELLESLPSLANGEAWVWSPFRLKTMERIRVRRRSTFDSGATPKTAKKAPPAATLADVNLPALAKEWSATIEKAKQEDPRALQRRVAELERELAAARARPAATTTKEVRMFTKQETAAVLRLAAAFERHAAASERLATDLRADVLARVREKLGVPAAAPPPSALVPRTNGAAPPLPRAAPLPVRPARATYAAAAAAAPGLKAGARRMLEMLLRVHPSRLTRQQLGTLAGISASSGTFSDYLGALRRAELMSEASDGRLEISANGREVAVGLGLPTRPLTSEEVLARWKGAIKAGARRMLDELIAAGDRGLSRAELGERAGIAPSSGTFSDYLGVLRRNGLADVDGQTVSVNPTLTHPGAP